MQRKILMVCMGLASSLCAGQLNAGLISSARVAVVPTAVTSTLNLQGAQLEERRWVSLDDTQKPGTAAVIATDPKQSNSRRTVFEITIPGFWMTDKKGDDGRIYQQIEIPGLGSHNQLGAPDLPRYDFRLALPYGKGVVRMSGKVESMKTFRDILVWPQSVPEMDGDGDTGTPEKFVLDRKVYAGDGN